MISQNRTYFNVNSESGVLYTASSTGRDAVMEFIKHQAPVNGQKLLPRDFIENSNIIDVARDIDETVNSNLSSTKEHYVLNQTIEGVEVYGASVIVHIKNGNEIYSTSGNITTSNMVTRKVLEESKAVEKAINEAIKEAGTNELEIIETKIAILNFKVLGLADDDTNHLVFVVQVDTFDHLFSKRYFVSLETGDILYDESLVLEAKNRNVYDCGGNTNPQNCPLSRSDNSPNPTGVNDVDILFEYMGLVYDYYFNNFKRDGLDGRGSPMESYARIYSWTLGGSPVLCSVRGNAYRSPFGFLAFCPGTVTIDVTAHEFGHGVVGATVGLFPGYQYSALNESISDSFASALDGDWLMDGGVLGLIRSLENPPSIKSHPDRVFSPNYDCVNEEVHTNAGIPNKAFFLMTAGGSFNGCTVNGIGVDRSQQILYKVLSSKYIPQTANFYDMYSGVNQACADLYGSGSNICEEVKKAYQATEMDQQPVGIARGAACLGQTPQPATCAGATTSAGSIPTTTLPPGVTLTATPTVLPGTTATLPPGTTPTPTIPTGTSTPSPTKSVFIPKGTPTPTPDQYFTCKPDPKCLSGGKSIQLCPLICTPI